MHNLLTLSPRIDNKYIETTQEDTVMQGLSKLLSKSAAFMVAKVPYVFGNYTLGWKASHKRISRWYSTNDVYRFPVGAKIRARKCVFGYGIRAEGVVIAHKNHPDITGELENRYVVEITRDSVGDWHRWVNEDYVDPSAERVSETQVHFKWNLENRWCYSTPWHIRMFNSLQSRLAILRREETDTTLRCVHQ
ncbi:MAG: hypothetical protein AAGA35_03265 [Patescibacteria group bacterium]